MGEHWVKLEKKHEQDIQPRDCMQPVKCFELRKDDCDYQEGDFLFLCTIKDGEFTGHVTQFQIEKIWRDIDGLQKDYVILGIHFIFNLNYIPIYEIEHRNKQK